MVTAEVFTHDQTKQRYHEQKGLIKGHATVCSVFQIQPYFTHKYVAIVIYIEFLNGCEQFMLEIEETLLCSDMQTYS